MNLLASQTGAYPKEALELLSNQAADVTKGLPPQVQILVLSVALLALIRAAQDHAAVLPDAVTDVDIVVDAMVTDALAVWVDQRPLVMQ